MRAPILALLLLALASSRAFAAETTDTIAGVQANCLSASSTPAWSAGASTTECETCVSTIGNLAGLLSQRMYACYSVCQDPALFTGPTTGAQCISCIETEAYTVQACKDCMSPAVSAVGGTASCKSCLDSDPFAADVLTQATQYKRDSYFYACAQCSTIPTDEPAPFSGDARAQCYECISTKEARLQSDGGMLTYAEVHSPGYPVGGRDNDFGACVFLANQTYLIAKGSVEVTGIYASCVPETGVSIAISPRDCMLCMTTVEDSENPAAPSKAYGCADYCQKLSLYPAGSDVASISTMCESCLADPNIATAWPCGNCIKTAVPEDCFSCVASDPYGGNTSNYNWACGMCAQVEDDALRSLCLTCIKSQPGSGPEHTNEFTEANICSCIDLIQNNSIHVDRPLTAMELTCYEPFTKRDSSGNLLPSPAIPWGASLVDTNTSDCVLCMRDASVGITLPGLNKAYACHEYCQDPDLVTSTAQGAACSSCVTNANVHDPSACKTCMSATDNDVNRAKCFQCVTTPGITHGSNHAWGCGQCAQLPTSVQAFCFKCLSDDVLDPCECIDGIKNGTLLNAPGNPVCPPSAPNQIEDGCFEGCAGVSGTCGWHQEAGSNGGFTGFYPETNNGFNFGPFASFTGCHAYYSGGAIGSENIQTQNNQITGIEAGWSYQVSWWMNAPVAFPSAVDIIVDGVSILSLTNPSTSGWQQYTATFAGATHSPTLTFSFGVRNDPAFIGITGITLTCVP